MASIGESAKRRKTDNMDVDMDYFVQKVVTSNLTALLCRVMRLIDGAQAIFDTVREEG